MLRAAVQIRPELRAMTHDQSKEAYLNLLESRGYHIRHCTSGRQVFAIEDEYINYYDRGLFDHACMRWKAGVPGCNKGALVGIIVVGA